MGCKGSDEQRRSRHKEIAELVKELRIIDKENFPTTPSSSTSLKFDPATLDGSASKKERKEQKRRERAASRTPVVREGDIEHIGQILYPGKSRDEDFRKYLLMDESINDNLYYHPDTSSSRQERLRFFSHERSGKVEIKLSDEEMNRIMTELKVFDSAHNKNKKERDIVNNLKEKINEDAVHDQREAQEFWKRKASFWRWASRKVYDRLVANERIWDWKNGDAHESGALEHEANVDNQEAPEVVATEEEATTIGETDADTEITRSETADDLSSVLSLTSEESRSRPTLSSTASRGTSMSSMSRTTLSSTQLENSSSEEWTPVVKSKTRPKPKPLKGPLTRTPVRQSATAPSTPATTVKLSANKGLEHFGPATTPRALNVWTKFSALSMEGSGKEHENDDDDAVSPRTPCPKRR